MTPCRLQADHVDAADLRGIAVDDHEPGHVVVDPRQAADVAVARRSSRTGAPRRRRRSSTYDSTWPWPPSIVLLAMMTRSPSMQSCATWTLTIRRLFEPIRVRPSSFSLPRWMVTPSRMTLWSPISTRVGLPLVGDVLGLAADDGEGVDDVVLAQRGLAEDAGVGDQAGASADRARPGRSTQ